MILLRNIPENFKNSQAYLVFKEIFHFVLSIYIVLLISFALAYLATVHFDTFRAYMPLLHELILWYTSTLFSILDNIHLKYLVMEIMHFSFSLIRLIISIIKTIYW
jgi:hypothetical protein